MAANFWTSSQAASLSPAGARDGHSRDKFLGLTEKQLDQITFFHISYIQDLVNVASKAGVRHRVAATACTYFRRIYVRCSFSEVDPRGAAPGAIYLAAKVEETHLPMKLLFQAMARLSAKYPAIPLVDVKALVELEMLIMEKLQFMLLTWHPAPDLCALLASPNCNGLQQHAWSVMNDSYQTPVLLMHPPHIIALACITLAAVLQRRDMQEWLQSLNADLDQVNAAANIITTVYDHKLRASSDDVNSMMAKLLRSDCV